MARTKSTDNRRVYSEDGVVWLQGLGHGTDVSYESALNTQMDELCELLNRTPGSVRELLDAAEKLSERMG